MAEQVTSQFPKMGEEGIPHSFVDLSSRPSPYTMPQPRHRSGTGPGASDNTPGTGTKVNKTPSLIKNAQGPPVTHFPVLYEANAACATDVEKNLVVMSTAGRFGSGNFWQARQGRSEGAAG